MDIPVGDRWAAFVEAAVQSGRYISATDLITEGLRLVEEREIKLVMLRQALADSVAEDDWTDDADVDAGLDAFESELGAASG